MKVVQINAIYGSKSTGTIVRDIQTCCEENGIACYVAYSISDRLTHDVPRGYRIGNLFTAKWHAFASRLFGKQAYFNRFSTWRFIRWLDKLKPDVVHLHNLHSNYICLNYLLRFLAERDIPVVITMHDCWYYTGGCVHYTSVECKRWQTTCGQCPQRKSIPSWFHDSTSSVLKDRAHFLNAIPRLTMVGVSEWIVGEVKQSAIKNKSAICIHNGFDLNVFRPIPSEKKEQLSIKTRFVILGPGEKWLLPVNKPTLDYFIERMSKDTSMVLFGCSFIPEGLSSKIVPVGYIKNRQEMAELYSMADVFVNCSREDTLSSLNLECQACGTPVVTYDATGSAETVDGECGFSVPTGDAEALWNTAEKVLEIGKDKLTNKCRAWIETSFEKNANYREYIDLYGSITNKR